MKVSARVIIFLIVVLASCQQVSAKCGGACISIDSIGNSIHQTDTAYLRAGDLLKIYAKYDHYCPQMELVFYRDGIPFDTTDFEDAKFDNIWTWYTHIFIDQPGLYEVYFMGFQHPNYLCNQLLVLEDNDEISTGPLPSVVENEQGTNMHFRIYPNPSYDGMINIDGQQLEYVSKIEILDVAGAKVFDAMPQSGGVLQIPTENFHQGLYMVRIQYQGRSMIQKVVIH